MKVRTFTVLLALGSCAAAQNVVIDSGTKQTLPPAEFDPLRVEAVVLKGDLPAPAVREDPERIRIRTKLIAHVEALVRGWPWRPFHCTLGISGSETYFDHPDELYYALAISLPHLPKELGVKVKALLAGQLSERPPYAVDGFDQKGLPRERYEVPEPLRRTGRGKALSLFGVAAFGAYLHATDSADLLNIHWEAIKERVGRALDERKAADRIDPDVLNGDLAGLIAFARFAKVQADQEVYDKAMRRLALLADARVAMERTNAELLVPTKTATKTLHHVKLARFDHLIADVVEILSQEEQTLGAARLKSFREARPGWWMAFGDRTIGGENYINPPHLSNSVMAAAALIEKVDHTTLARWIDVPWCEADLFFIEKCVLALEAR